MQLALERVGRQRHAGRAAGPEFLPVDRGAGRPELAETPGHRQRIGVRPGVIGQRLDDGHRGVARQGLLGEGRKRIAGAHFEQDRRVFSGERRDGLLEIDRRAGLSRPIGRVGALGLGDPAAGDATHVRDRRRVQAYVAERVFKRVADRVHHRRMEGVRGVETSDGDVGGLEPGFHRVDRLEAAGEHVEPWRVAGGDVDAAVEMRLQRLHRGADREHRAAGLGLHQLAAFGDDAEAGFEIHHAGQRGGGELADRMSDHRHGHDAACHPQLRVGILGQEQGGLGQPGLAQGARHLLVARVAEAEHGLEVEPDDGREDLGAGVDPAGKFRLALVEPAAHAGVLRALPREQEGDPARAGKRRFAGGGGAAQRRDHRGAVVAGHGGPVFEPGPALLQRVGDIREGQGGIRLQRIGEPRLHRGQRFGRSGRQRQHLHGVGQRPRRQGRGLFQHQMRVGAADAEGADPGAQRSRRGPGFHPGGNAEGRAGEVDILVQPAEIGDRRQFAGVQHQRGLDHADHACGRVHVADIALD